MQKVWICAWTRSCFCISCFLSFLYSLIFLQKVWTGGQALKKNQVFHTIRDTKRILGSLHTVISWFLSFFPSIYFFLFLSCTLQNVLQKLWTGGQALRILRSLMTTVHISLFKSVDMWIRSCLCVSCFLSLLYPLNFWEKAWTGGQVLNFLKKKINFMYFIFQKCGIWTRSCLSISCFLSFLYSFIFFQKLWTGWTSSEYSEKKSTPCMSLLQSVDMWTISCRSISCFLSFLYPLRYLQKVWTCGQEAIFLFHVLLSFLVL